MFRSELIEAVQSVRAQEGVEGLVEIVVVADKHESELDSSMAHALQSVDRVIFTGGGAGAPAARNLGVRKSSGEWVAFLDDDDYWIPTKLKEQLAAAKAHSDPISRAVVISARVQQSKGQGRPISSPVPTHCLRDGQDVERYLFEGRKPTLGRSSIFTSTLFTSKHLAVSVPWNESLNRHQDWDWLIRAQRAGARVVQLNSVLSIQRVGSSGSISASTDWRSSLAWAREWKNSWPRQTYVDFVVGQPLRYALQGRSARGVFECFRDILSARRVPSLGPALIGLAGLMSRAQLERLLVTTKPTQRA